jgi:general secretion pathway protein J
MNGCRRHPAGPRNGFTLLEILVALAVFGMLAVGLQQSMRFSQLARNSAARTTTANDAFDGVDRTLRHLIMQLHPGTDTSPAPFAGSPERLAFVSTLPGQPDMPARRVEATLSVDRDHRLVLRWRPYLHATSLQPAPFTQTELLRGVDHMEVAFWQPESGWLAAWQSADLPALVRIRLVFVQPTQRRWPDLVAAPALDRP